MAQLDFIYFLLQNATVCDLVKTDKIFEDLMLSVWHGFYTFPIMISVFSAEMLKVIKMQGDERYPRR